MRQAQKGEASHAILIDDIDRFDLTTKPALRALVTIERLFEVAPPEYTFSGQEVANLLRCVNMTVRRGYPL
jgi:hypothetical protein